MRVLMTSLAVEAHFNGTVPLAWALRAAGHEVHFASQPALAPAITRAGLTAVPVGADHGHHEIVRELGAELTGFYRDIDVTGERGGLRDRKAANSLLTATFYAQANNDSMVDDLVAYARWWQPDLVIWEQFTFAGGVAARACGAVGVRLLWGPDLFGRSRARFRAECAALPPERRDDALEEWLTWTLNRHGLDYDERVVTGHFAIDQMPEGVRVPTPGASVPMRYVPYNGLSEIPGWLRETPERPRICLTLGITSRDMPYPNLISPSELFDAVADLDIEIVATLNEAEVAEVGRIPANTRVVGFVPLHALMPTCAAIIHQGGAGHLVYRRGLWRAAAGGRGHVGQHLSRPAAQRAGRWPVPAAVRADREQAARGGAAPAGGARVPHRCAGPAGPDARRAESGRGGGHPGRRRPRQRRTGALAPRNHESPWGTSEGVIMALFAVLATQAPAAGEAKEFRERLGEGFAYTRALVEKGVIRHSWIRVGASGGLNIYEVASHEELLKVLYDNPVSPHLKFEVIPLARPDALNPDAQLAIWHKQPEQS